MQHLDPITLILYIILPIAAVILIGFCCRHLNCFPESFGPLLLKFSVIIGLPTLLFFQTAAIPPGEIENLPTYHFLGVFTAGMLLTFFLALLFYWRCYRSDIAHSAIAALNASMSNSALLALPILVSL